MFLSIFVCDSLLAHGTIISPESRIYKCRFRGNVENHSDPACRAAIDLGGKQAIYDWTALRQANANSQHQTIIPDGELCSGGNSDYQGMDLNRTDWRTSEITPDADGTFEFVYYGTAPHATKDWIFYITKESWSPGTPLRWSNIEEFCTLGEVPLVQDSENRSVYRFRCNLPERTGKHVIYNIWQRSDSEEAFYSCSDVQFSDEGEPVTDSKQEVCFPAKSANGAMTLVCL